MDATELAEALKEAADDLQNAVGPDVETEFGHSDADFFVTVDGTRFLVTVAQVSG